MTRALGLALLALVLAQASWAANCGGTQVGLTPLSDLATATFKGYGGGLYPGGRNEPTPEYLKRGLAYAAQVKPRGQDGRPSSSGTIVLLSIGMSNTTMEFSAFKALADRDARMSEHLTIVDGAQGGQDAERIKDPSAPFWTVVAERLATAGVTGAQVQAVWLKEAIARENEPFPADARRLQADLATIDDVLRARFPNLRLIYLASRTYAGYATTQLNPEPYAYDSGFAVKWLIQQRIERRLAGPWLGWGPYLWTDGTAGRRDGLVWTCDDTLADGTHPSPSGRQKVAQLLLRFFETDPTARPWFSSA